MEESLEKSTKTLIDNWVEERQCQTLGLENNKYNNDGTICSKLHRQGHKGILSTKSNIPIESTSTIMTSYTVPVKCNVMTTGIRSSLLVDHVYKTVMDELETEQVIAQQNDTTPIISTTKHDFYKDVPDHVIPTTVQTEKQISYWNSNKANVTGISKIVNEHCPFNRHTKFSTPIEQRLEEETA